MTRSAYEHGVTSTPLLGRTIGDDLRRTARRVADRDALVSLQQDVRYTYRDLDQAVDRLASGLLAAGVRKGDRVGIWSPNCAEWVLVQYATARVGAVLVNVNPAYRTHEVAFALRQSGVKVLVSAPTFKSSDYVAMIESVRGELADLERIVYLSSPEWERLSSTEIDREALEARRATLSFDDPINIQYTSGTTGAPKGATLSHHNILNNGFFVAELLGYDEHDRVCLPVPFYHCFGMVMGNLGCTTHGACIVIPAPSFDAEATLHAVAAERCTSLYGVPTMFIAMLEHPGFADYDIRSLRTGIMAGAPCPVEVMADVIERMHMREVAICYGMTETSPVSTQTRRDDGLDRRVGTVGRAAPHVEVKIVDPDTGLVVDRGRSGELCTRGYSVMVGYWNAPEQTAGVLDEAGWMHTGDLAVMDDDGYVSIVGRIKDMVIRGGENVYPREIEEFLHGHPDIVDVHVVGVPDQRYGEELCACVRLRDDATLDAASIRAFCDGRLAHYKIPRYVITMSEFPMTVTGKVQKFKLRDAATAELGLGETAAG